MAKSDINRILKESQSHQDIKLSRNERTRSATMAFLSKLDEKKLFSGSVLIAKDGEILLSTGVGNANPKAKNDKNTVYRIGSVTKQFTAAAIMQLLEQRKLKLDDPISAYIPDAPRKWDKITIYHLLTHTSGIHNITDTAKYNSIKINKMTPDELLAVIEQLPMDFTPGAHYKYSNSGYIVLGKIIENVSKSSYGDYLADHIFSVVGMHDSGYLDLNVNNTDQAVGYTAQNADEQYVDLSVPYAAGGLRSTVEDLFKWDRALATDSVLDGNAISEMMSPHVAIVKNTAFYGYGWMIGERFDRKLVTHGGGIECFSSQISKYTDEDITIIVLCNKANISAGFIENEIATIVFSAK